ncbi:Hypothetical protein SSCIU_02510 [Mammaliicoccus sciuri]|nr:Hypothetical protein SSCIU_02510 [Mammaliicoccus sciuri]
MRLQLQVAWGANYSIGIF